MCARNWLTVGCWGLSCRLLQNSSHCLTDVLYANCVLTLYDALMIWVAWGDSCWEVPKKTAATRLSQSQIGCCEFVPGSWSRCWWVGINSGVVPVFTNCTNCGNHGCLPTGNYHQGCRLIPCKFGQHSSNYTKWGEIQELRFNQHTEKAFTWYVSGSGLYDAYILRTFGIQATSKQTYFCFPKLIKKGLSKPLV